MADTIFDKIIRKELPADIIYEDDLVLAFKDLNPQAPTHVLIIPKNKFTSFANLAKAKEDVIGRYVIKIAEVAKTLGLEEEGYRIVFNHGKHGQQTVDYIHAHIIGGRQLKWPPG